MDEDASSMIVFDARGDSVKSSMASKFSCAPYCQQPFSDQFTNVGQSNFFQQQTTKSQGQYIQRLLLDIKRWKDFALILSTEQNKLRKKADTDKINDRKQIELLKKQNESLTKLLEAKTAELNKVVGQRN